MIWATNFGSIDNKFIAPNDKEETNIQMVWHIFGTQNV